MIGGLLLVAGLIGVAWGFFKMYEGRDKMDLERDAEIIVEDGDFPTIGIAGAIVGGIGLLIIVVGSVGGRRSR
jgi:hypothetical protein